MGRGIKIKGGLRGARGEGGGGGRIDMWGDKRSGEDTGGAGVRVGGEGL